MFIFFGIKLDVCNHFESVHYITMKKVVPLFLVAVVLFSCDENTTEEKDVFFEKTLTPILKNEVSFINPPIKGLNVPKESFTVNAKLGDTLFDKSGSILIFPKNSFVDASGNIIKGDVKVEYREFSDPFDFFVSGIPMDYDSSGVNYQFESSGMCEVVAHQNNKSVFVNQNAQPEINMVSGTNSPSHNLYQLDTVKRNWMCKGKPAINDLTKAKEVVYGKKKINRKKVEKLIAPIAPAKANGEMPSFSVTIEPGSVKELEAYDNLNFEIIPENKNYKASDGDELWSDMRVEPSEKEGIYRVTFSNENKTVSYQTRPVFEGKSYDKALLVFKKRQKQYQLAVEKRLEKEEKIKERNKQIEAENERIRAANKKAIELRAIIAEQNRVIAAANSEDKRKYEVALDSLKKVREKVRGIKEKRQKEYDEKALKAGGSLMSNGIVRSFSIDGFGVWNCDNPNLVPGKQKIVLKAFFQDEKGGVLNFEMVSSVYKGFNGILCNKSPDRSDYSFPKFTIMQKSDNLIWAVKHNALYYLTYDDFKACAISESTKEYTFQLNKYKGELTSMEDVKKGIGF
jgi:hypothetical protein